MSYEQTTTTEILGTRIAGRKAEKQRHADLFGYNLNKSVGWEPATNTKRNQRIEDYADDEDLQMMMKNQMYQKGGYEKGGTDTPHNALITPCSDFIGAKLLRKMGWRPGFGVGGKKKKRRQKPSDDSDSDIELPPEPKVDLFFQKQKSRTEFSGPGYIPAPSIQTTPSAETHRQGSARTYMGSSRKLPEVDSDDDLQYTTEDMSLYDEAFINPLGHAKKMSSMQDTSRQHTQTLLRGYDPKEIQKSDQQFERWAIKFISSRGEAPVPDTAVSVPPNWTPDPRKATTTTSPAAGHIYDLPASATAITRSVPFQKQSNALNIRFTSGQKQDLQHSTNTFTGGLVTTDQLRQLTQGTPHSDTPDTSTGAVADAAGPLKLQKRQTRNWYPSEMLCKRFGVIDPHPQVAEKGDYPPSQVGGAHSHTTFQEATSASAFAAAADNDKRRMAAEKTAAKHQRRAQRKFDDFQNQIAESRRAAESGDVKKEHQQQPKEEEEEKEVDLQKEQKKQEEELKTRLLSLRLEKEKEINTKNTNKEYVTKTVSDIMSGFETATGEKSIAAAVFGESDDDNDDTHPPPPPPPPPSASIKQEPTSRSSAAAAVFDSDSDVDDEEGPKKMDNSEGPKKVGNSEGPPNAAARIGVLDRMEQNKASASPSPPPPSSVMSQRPPMSIFRSIFETADAQSSDSEGSSEENDNTTATKGKLLFSAKDANPSDLEKDNDVLRDRIARLREICDSSSDEESSSSSSDTEARRRKKKAAKKTKKKEKKKMKKEKKRAKKAKRKEKRKAKKERRKEKRKRRQEESTEDSSSEDGAI